MKKFVLCLLALCLSLCLLAGLAACDGGEEPAPAPAPQPSDPAGTPDEQEPAEPTEYRVTYVYGNGAENTVVSVPVGGFAVEPNDPVREGYTFGGWYAEGSTEAFNFSEAVRGDTTLTAHWLIPEPETVLLRWMASESTDYLYDAGVPRSAKVGDTVRFRLRLSPYYEGTPTVTAAGETLTPDGEGYYSFTVREATTVSVSGRTEIHTPIKGLGTSKSPYIISNASQLKDLTDAINSTSNTKYNEAYIRLDADIDLMGETLLPIGSTLNAAHFSGDFNGNGHTISNFTLAENAGICGFFGYLVTGDVYGLTLQGVTMEIEATEERNYIVGGIVAYNMGGTVSDCHISGETTVYSTLDPESYSIYVGGIVGFMQGYSTGYTGEVSFCTADMDLRSTGTHAVMTVGGIAAGTYGTAESATAMVFNCTYRGAISGKVVFAGGIVGYLRDLSGVANCFSSGSVHAEYAADFAAAGGIVGLAFNETAVSFCYSTAVLDCRSAEKDNITRGTAVGASYAAAINGVDDRAALVHRCYHSTAGSVTVGSSTFDLTSSADVLSLMGWETEEWSFADGRPTPRMEGYAKRATSITFDFLGQTVTKEGLDGAPVSQGSYTPELHGYTSVYWLCGGGGKNTFTSDAGLISYGYFLDAACTQRVPAAMMMTEDMTVYVGFADYSAAAGEYYLDIIDTNGAVQELRLVFDDNGKMTMYYDGKISNQMYTYDGTRLTIHDAYFAYIKYPSATGYDLDLDFYAYRENGRLMIYESILFTEESGNLLVAYPKNKVMGTWYTKSGGQYVFYADGTGLDATGGQFYYTVSESGVTINRGTSTVTAQFSAGGQLLQSTDAALSLSKYDAFRGTWEGDYSQGVRITFDGAGGVTFGSLQTSYTISSEGVLSFTGYTAAFRADGLLVLTETASGRETVLGVGGGCMGTWQETYLDYTLVLGGIGKDGYGRGYDSNGVEFTYNLGEENYCYLYYGMQLYGYFTIQSFRPEGLPHFGEGSELRVMSLAVYTPSSGYIVDDYSLCYVDGFSGTWYGEDGLTLEFNGLGAYDFRTGTLSSGGVWEASGKLTVTRDGVSAEITYRVDPATHIATFTYQGTVYTVSLAETGLVASVSGTTVRYAEPDAFDGYTFTDGTVLLSFNGRSLVGKGQATVTVGGTTRTYSYVIENGIAVLYEDTTAVGRADPTGTTGKLLLTLGETSASLGITHEMIGTEYLGAEGMIFRIDGLFDLSGVARGYLGTAEVSVFYLDGKSLSVYLDGTFLYYIVLQDSKNIAFFDENRTFVTVFTVADGYAGVYTAADGSTLELDGRSNASRFVYASAMLTVTEEDETVTYYYVYEIEDGVLTVYLLDRSGETEEKTAVYEILTTAQTGATAFTSEDGNTLYLVKIA